MLVIFIPIFRGQNALALRQQEQLNQLRIEVYNEAMRSDRLRDQIRTAETLAFREREARRRYGYVRPGVIRFVAEAPSAEWPQAVNAPADSAETLDKDWANFGI